jgi:tagatose 1,6-diphosphate aldolase
MKRNLSIGKLRGLQQLADPIGILTVCAMDHRASLQRALNSQNPDAVSHQDMVDFKLDLCKAVAPFASAVLLDPIYGAGQAIATGVLPGKTGLLVSIEKTGYSGEKVARITELLPDWSVAKVKRLGASAVKILLYFRPDLKDITARQLDLVARLADECIEQDIPLLVESVSYPTEAEGGKPEEFSRKKPELVIEAARQLTDLPIDVLKSEFPADINYEKDERKLMEACQQLDEASQLPWVLLSAGVDFPLFKKQVEIACKAGASGFMAGRALWEEATQIRSRDQRMNFFQGETVSRLQQLAEIADKYGKPWYAKMVAQDGQFAPVAEDWYQRY